MTHDRQTIIHNPCTLHLLGGYKMNFSKQLKKYRELNGYSQEILAEKIYVTRQRISKWKNDKTYPDIHNLIVLSVLFEITLDKLVKGDVATMKKNGQQ